MLNKQVMSPLLSIRALSTCFQIQETVVKAVDNVSLDIYPDEVLALVGETGCGKSVLALSILRLLPENSLSEGSILYKGFEILEGSNEELRALRGREIGMIPQSQASSLNPLLKVGWQVMEVLRLHTKVRKPDAHKKVVELFSRLQLPEPEKRMDYYPHQLSGGMRQRVLVSMGVACNPNLILVDEPTKGLDAVLRMEVVKLLGRQAAENNRSMLLITHDLSVAALLADRIAVMYAGEIVEMGSSAGVLKIPRHPYTQSLLDSLPGRGFKPIPGFSPSLSRIPPGCRFQPRCRVACSKGAALHPDLREADPNHYVRCFHAD
ncbi:ABC transporter ATP-binding protein [Desulfosporosinus hippei]|uniref:Nickel import system ATP-binding protein NikD n=1 Tax=Desulfosporosinus hippei DSM 8344 TaxID=1121419 RepID=A0A1G7T8T0_9FIRM|nr:ABC transporter ATP-binding protein [Desulfosporosinus hippei]SDG31010.1 peptide/nickel transport system ATP-binding protein [Desulfosporosinus hippei DSM 8344]